MMVKNVLSPTLSIDTSALAVLCIGFDDAVAQKSKLKNLSGYISIRPSMQCVIGDKNRHNLNIFTTSLARFTVRDHCPAFRLSYLVR